MGLLLSGPACTSPHARCGGRASFPFPAQLHPFLPSSALLAPSDFIWGAAAGSARRIQSVFVAGERLDNDNLCVRAEPRQR